MTHGPFRAPRYVLERWVQRGPLHQLLLMSAAVATVAALGGVAAWAFTPAFDSLPVAIWWAFLRLTDPGYLGDDEGTALRVVSTTVTVLGYVLFMGSLIAILTQWLSMILRQLERGLTPIVMHDHFVVLGWTNRTPEIVRKLLTAGGRIDRFFERWGVRRARLRVVVQADEVDAVRRQLLRDELGAAWHEGEVLLRSGSSMETEHLLRLDIRRAAIVIVPGADFEMGGAEMTDTRVVKTLLTLDAVFRAGGGDAPRVVAEVVDPRKTDIAQDAIEDRAEVIATDLVVSRLLSQSLRHAGAAPVLFALFTHREGGSIYLRAAPELTGERVNACGDLFPHAVLLGVVRQPASRGGGGASRGVDPSEAPRALLDPADDLVLREDDLLVLVASSHEDTAPDLSASGGDDRSGSSTSVAAPGSPQAEATGEPETRRLLVMGWSWKLRALLAELAESSADAFDVTILSRLDIAERERFLRGLDTGDGHVRVHHVEADYTIEAELRAAGPASFDHVLLMASTGLETSQQSDARTVLGYLLLRRMLAREESSRPEVLVELLDPDSARVLGEDRGGDVLFVSPRIMSHLLAHVALRPELNAVYDALICTGGAEIELRHPARLGLSDECTFRDAKAAAAAVGEVALGFLTAHEDEPPQVDLAPPRDTARRLREDDRVIVLATQS